MLGEIGILCKDCFFLKEGSNILVIYDFSQTMNNWHEYERKKKKKKYKENSIYLSPQVDFFPSDVSLFYDYVVLLKCMKQHLIGCKCHI